MLILLPFHKEDGACVDVCHVCVYDALCVCDAICVCVCDALAVKTVITKNMVDELHTGMQVKCKKHYPL